MTTQPRNYWMVVVRQDYAEVCRRQGFTLLGMPRLQKKRVQRMEVGDRLLLYVSDLQAFVAVATIASPVAGDESPLWPAATPGETYPWRLKLTPNVVLDEQRMVDARLLAPRLDYVRKWTPERWPLAFVGPLHLIPKHDFQLIEHEMRRARQVSVRPARPAPPAEPGACVLDGMPVQGLR